MQLRFLAILISAVSASLTAQDYLTPETLWQLGRVSLDDVSPDGKTALFGVTWYDIEINKGNRDLYLVPVAGGTAKRITAFDGTEHNGRYFPDENHWVLTPQNGLMWQREFFGWLGQYLKPGGKS